MMINDTVWLVTLVMGAYCNYNETQELIGSHTLPFLMLVRPPTQFGSLTTDGTNDHLALISMYQRLAVTPTGETNVWPAC